MDVNGAKPPNMYGRDTFLFEITNGKGPLLYPFGGSDYDTAINGGHWDAESGGCGVNGSTAGFYCAGRILEEGWEMNY